MPAFRSKNLPDGRKGGRFAGIRVESLLWISVANDHVGHMNRPNVSLSSS